MLDSFRYHAGELATSLSLIKFSGSDVQSFLQSQSTIDTNKISANSFHLASFLDPQGRLETYGWLTFNGKGFSYLVPSSLASKTLERLNRFLISEDVELSSPETIDVHFIVGPDSDNFSAKESFSGILFDEKSFLQFKSSSAPGIPAPQAELWRGLTGWPSFDGSDYSHEILNNLRLFDLSLMPNKGCYPGQETVSKIATRRGAAYSPVLLELNTCAGKGDIFSFDKKIGTSIDQYSYNGKFYLSCSLLRDFRVENMKLHFTLNERPHEGVVKYFPLIKGDSASKALELYYQASEDFRFDRLEDAEKNFRLSIKIDPTLADAYESLGVMLGRQERFQEAIDIMKQLSDINPKSVLAHTNMSLYLMRLGKIEEAEEQKSLATVKSFQSFGDEAKRKEQEEASKNQKKKEWEQRESMFRQVLEIDSDDTLANYGLGSIAVEKGDWETARIHLEKVIEQDPKYSVAYLALGKALKGMGLLSEAKSVWEEGIKVAAAKGDLMPANQMQQELSF